MSARSTPRRLARRTLLAVFAAAALAGRAESARPANVLEEARALQQRGALGEARQRYEAALPELRKSDPRSLGEALNALSFLDQSQAAYDSAAARAREAAEVFRSIGDRGGEARALYLTGNTELYQAQYPAALRHLEEALAGGRAAGDRQLETEALNQVGTVHFLQARYLDALRSYREAVDAVQRGGNEPWSARLRRVTLTNLAALFQRLGQNEQALQIYMELRNSPEVLRPSEHARLLSNLGVLYRRLGDPVKALETYAAAQSLLATDEHSDRRIGVLSNIGIVQALDMGDLRAALAAFSEALSMAERTSNRREAMEAHLYRAETFRRRGDSTKAARDFEAAIALAKELGTVEEEWKGLFGLGLLSRAQGNASEAARRFTDAISRIESVRAGLQIASLKTDFLADKRDPYDALVEILLERRDVPAAFDLLERARARAFQDRLPGPRPSLREAAARLDDETAILEYWTTARSAAVLWLTRDAQGVVPLPATAVDPKEISALSEAASSPERDDWRRPAAALGSHLFAAVLRDLPARVRHLVIVPDGQLAQVPFELLDAGDGALLLERFDVSYLPTAALLDGGARAAQRWAPPWKRQLVVFADPRVISSSRGARELGGPELANPLPASREEAYAIARACPGRSQLFLGTANVKAPLLEGGATGVPLLHLATHAVADLTNPERSRILFSPAQEQSGADYLFLKEIYDLDLHGVEVATLSACETERGRLVRGEGLYGFSRALLSAGARSSITTLWRVADEPTRDFMGQFYVELNRGQSKAQALRLAKLRFLRSGTTLAHPRFWAAFVLTGDGFGRIPVVVSWSRLLALAALLVAAGAAATFRLRKPRPATSPQPTLPARARARARPSARHFAAPRIPR